MLFFFTLNADSRDENFFICSHSVIHFESLWFIHCIFFSTVNIPFSTEGAKYEIKSLEVTFIDIMLEI